MIIINIICVISVFVIFLKYLFNNSKIILKERDEAFANNKLLYEQEKNTLISQSIDINKKINDIEKNIKLIEVYDRIEISRKKQEKILYNVRNDRFEKQSNKSYEDQQKFREQEARILRARQLVFGMFENKISKCWCEDDYEQSNKIIDEFKKLSYIDRLNLL